MSHPNGKRLHRKSPRQHLDLAAERWGRPLVRLLPAVGTLAIWSVLLRGGMAGFAMTPGEIFAAARAHDVVAMEAVRDTMPGLLSEDERRWVKLAIEREAQSIKLRQAIIEKTLGSLLWAAIAGAGLVLLDYLRSHGMRL